MEVGIHWRIERNIKELDESTDNLFSTVEPRYTSLIRSRYLDLYQKGLIPKKNFPIRNKRKIINLFP